MTDGAQVLPKKISQPFQLLWKHRHILWQTTRNDVRARFAGSVLGLGWLIFYPLLLLGAYAFVYIFVFKVKFALFNANEYVALIFCGLIPFIGFSEAIGIGIPSVNSNASLIKNTLFPIELIPVKTVFLSQCTQVAGMILLGAVLAAMGKLSLWTLMVAPIWCLQMMFTMGLIWILSSLNVYFRDLQNMSSIFILILMMVSPIAYTPDMVPDYLRPFLAVNPLYYIITCYQDAFMIGQFPRGNSFPVLAALGFGLYFGGFWFFSRMKEVFADNV